MKTKKISIAILGLLIVFACSKDNDPAKSQFQHSGQKWKISTVNYNIVDQGLSNPLNWVQTGSANDAGAFYLDGSEGSFDIVINGNQKEDYFSYKIDGSSISILQVDQSISTSKISQNVITFSGEISDDTMTLSGTITNQAMVNQYVFTGDIVLTRE